MPNLREPNGLKKGRRLDDLEHKSIEEADYKPKLKEHQLKLLTLTRELAEARRALVIIFEGPDAAGKGGAIKRIVERLDPRLLRVHSVIKPTAEESQRHYLWRFWNKLHPTARPSSSTAPGMAACSSSAWKVSPPTRNGNAPTTRSTTSSGC